MTCGVVGPMEECPECGRVLTGGKTGGHSIECSRYRGPRFVAESAPRRPSYAELEAILEHVEAILEHVRAYANTPDARIEEGFDPMFLAGDASCRRGLRNIPGIGA